MIVQNRWQMKLVNRSTRPSMVSAVGPSMVSAAGAAGALPCALRQPELLDRCRRRLYGAGAGCMGAFVDVDARKFMICCLDLLFMSVLVCNCVLITFRNLKRKRSLICRNAACSDCLRLRSPNFLPQNFVVRKCLTALEAISCKCPDAKKSSKWVQIYHSCMQDFSPFIL